MNEKATSASDSGADLETNVGKPDLEQPEVTPTPVAVATDVPVVEKPQRLGRAALVWRRFKRSKTGMTGLIGIVIIALIAIFGPMIYPWDFQTVDRTAFLKPPSGEHWFGTTKAGLDIMALTLEGLRKSMIIGLVVALLQTAIAAIIGASAAYFGKWVEKIILWFVDLMLVIPSFLIIAIISRQMGSMKGSIPVFIILLAAFGWMLTARVIRSMTLAVKNLDYVRAARYMSVPSWVIIFKHIIPNVSSYLIIDFTLGMAFAVLSETTLSYFNFGVQPPNTSLGTLIAEGAPMATTFPWVFLAPALFLVAMLTMVNFMGDALRDAIDPSSKSGGAA